MILPDALDVAAGPEATVDSPLATIAAQPVAEAVTTAVPEANAAIAAPAAVAPAATPTLGTATATPLGTLSPATPATLPMLGALLLVVALILVLGKLVKRVQGARTGAAAALSVKGGVQVGTKERVVWMQAGETHLLLGVSPGRVQTLHVFDVAPDFASRAAQQAQAQQAQDHGEASPLSAASQDFADRLKQLLTHARAKGMALPTVSEALATPGAAPLLAAAPKATQSAEAAPAVQATAANKPLFSFRA